MQHVRFIVLAGMLYGNREPSGMLYVRFIELACILSSTGEHVEFIEQSGMQHVRWHLGVWSTHPHPSSHVEGKTDT